MSTQPGDSVFALLTDGTTIEIRPAGPDDFDAVRDMFAKMSTDNLYLRFFSMSPAAAEGEARRVCRKPAPDRAAVRPLSHRRQAVLLRAAVLEGRDPAERLTSSKFSAGCRRPRSPTCRRATP